MKICITREMYENHQAGRLTTDELVDYVLNEENCIDDIILGFAGVKFSRDKPASFYGITRQDVCDFLTKRGEFAENNELKRLMENGPYLVCKFTSDELHNGTEKYWQKRFEAAREKAAIATKPCSYSCSH